MLNYLIRRLMLGGLTLVLITMLVYLLIRSMPGSPLLMEAAMSDPSRKISPADYKRMEKNYGLDKPAIVGYYNWVVNLTKGDLGRSFHYKRPVRSIIAQRIGPTLTLGAISMALSLVLAIPLGLWSTARSGNADERVVSVFLYMLYALPSFVAGLLLLIVFYVRLEGTIFQLPRGGIVSPGYELLSGGAQFLDILRHLALPTICYTYGSLAYYSRFVKANMEEAIRQDYCRTARAKGATPMSILIRHAFRNTLVPWMTSLGMMLPALVSGSVILEQLFDWPGMGQLFFDAIMSRDYPVIMAETLMFSILTLTGQLLADIAIAAVDPRVSYR